MVAESLISMLPTPRPVQFPGDPPPTLSWVEQRQSETSREQTRVSLTAFSDTDVEHREERCTPSPYLSQVLWHRAVLVAAQHCLHLLRFIWAGVKAQPNSGAEQTGGLWVLVRLQVKSSALHVHKTKEKERCSVSIPW